MICSRSGIDLPKPVLVQFAQQMVKKRGEKKDWARRHF